MKIALLGDTHFGLKGDNEKVNEFFAKCYTEWFFPALQERGITQILQLGDLFDKRKTIDFYSLASAREYFFDEAVERGINIVALLGNHDVFYKNTLSLNAPELLLNDYPNVWIINKPHTTYGIDIIPWICQDNYTEVMDFMEQSSNKICVGHFELKGFAMYRGLPKSEHGLTPDVLKSYDKVYSGHFHTRSSDKNVEYIGTPMEMTWNDYDDPRGFVVLDTETGETEFVQNPYTLFSKLYYNEDNDLPDVSLVKDKYVRLVVEKRTDVKKYEKYLEKLNAAGPIELKTIEDFTALEGRNVDVKANLKDATQLLKDYVEEAETDLDKNKLTDLMLSLHVEAMNME